MSARRRTAGAHPCLGPGLAARRSVLGDGARRTTTDRTRHENQQPQPALHVAPLLAVRIARLRRTLARRSSHDRSSSPRPPAAACPAVAVGLGFQLAAWLRRRATRASNQCRLHVKAWMHSRRPHKLFLPSTVARGLGAGPTLERAMLRGRTGGPRLRCTSREPPGRAWVASAATCCGRVFRLRRKCAVW